MSNEINFSFIDYSFYTRSLDIFTIGCVANPRCEGCCNPELWDFSQEGISVSEALKKVQELNRMFNPLIDRILIVGGDPVDGYFLKDGVCDFIQQVKVLTNKPIYLFTRHELDKVPQKLKDIVDYIKCGPYCPELTTDDNWQYNIKLATSNQKIYSKDKGEF